MPLLSTQWTHIIKGRSVADGINPAHHETHPLRLHARAYDDLTVEPVYYPGQFVALDELGAATTPWHGDPPATTGKSLYHQFGVLRFNDHSPGPWLKGLDTPTPPSEIKPGNYRLDYTEAGFTAPTEPVGAPSYRYVDNHGTSWTQEEQRGCWVITDAVVMSVPIEKGDLTDPLTPGQTVYLVDAWRLTTDPTVVTNAYPVGRLRKPIKIHMASTLELWAVYINNHALDAMPAA